MNNNILRQLYTEYQKRFEGVDKPEFYNSWQPNADPGMQFTPSPDHPAMNDKNNYSPDGQMPPANLGIGAPRMEMSALRRLMGMG